MNLLNFISEYSDEESCKLKLKAIRDAEGIVCRHCWSKEHYWKKDKWQDECKVCKFRTTLRSGKVIHGSQMTFRYWFIALHLLISTKKSFSALELQRQLGHKYYEPMTMLHKLRLVMGEKDDQYKFSDEIELDEGFFSTTMLSEKMEQPLKRGLGSQKKFKVLVMTESKEVEEKPTKKGKPRKVGFIKMQIIPDLKADTINDQASSCISDQATLITYDSTTYVNFASIVKEHQSKVIPKENIVKVLPWVHITISNAKRMLLDIHHSINPMYLQSYLNEFCYKFNRRYFGEILFDKLLLVCATSKNKFKYRMR